MEALFGGASGSRTLSPYFYDVRISNPLPYHPAHAPKFGGSGEIRTHGPFRVVCFQDRCNKPGSATLPVILAGGTRIELVLLESKSSVLPLHQPPTEKTVDKFLKNVYNFWSKPKQKTLDFLGLGFCV